MKLIPLRVYTCKVCPSTKVTRLSFCTILPVHSHMSPSSLSPLSFPLSPLLSSLPHPPSSSLTLPPLPSPSLTLPPSPSPSPFPFSSPPSHPQVILHAEQDCFTLDDSFQQPLTLYSPHRELLSATFYGYVLKNIGKCII